MALTVGDGEGCSRRRGQLQRRLGGGDSGDQNVRQGGGTQTQRDQIREVDWDLGCWVRCSLGDREPCKMFEQRRDLSRCGLLVGYLEGESGHKKR